MTQHDTPENKQIVNQFVADVLNKGDVAAADRYIDPAFVDHVPWPGQPGNLDGFKAGLLEFRAAFPDMKADAEKLVAEGDTVVGVFWLSGTHLGPFMGAEPTGKTFRVQVIDIVSLRDGKMVEHWGAFDVMAMSQQLGLAP